MSSASISQPATNYQSTGPNNNNLVSVNKNHTYTLTSTNVPNERPNIEGPVDNLVASSDPTVNKSWHGKGAGEETITRHLGDMVVIFLCSFFKSNNSKYASL